MSLYLFVVLGLLTGPVLVHGVEACASDPEYTANSATICLAANHAEYIEGSGGVTSTDQATIINKHIAFRSAVNPKATNMLKPVWDDNLAAFAQKWAQQCPRGHDTQDARKLRSDFNARVGQNIYSGNLATMNWNGAITAWHNEVSGFTYGDAIDATTLLQNGNVVGHYTQVVYADAAKIGCGYAKCNIPNSEYPSDYFVCNYIQGNGMGPGSIPYPYMSTTSSDTCSDNCGTHCIDNLCECGGKHCYNGGSLNLADCTCSCTYVWTGDQCLTKQCPPGEASTCDPNADCDYALYLQTTCPYACGICKTNENMTCEAHPGCHKSEYGCEYMGDQHTQADCATYGVSGADHSGACKSLSISNPFGCEECVKYGNVPTDYCPKMCAICP